MCKVLSEAPLRLGSGCLATCTTPEGKMIPLYIVRELLERHDGSRVDLLRSVASGTRVKFLQRLLGSAEARKTVESMDTSAFLRLLAAILEKSIARRCRKRLPDISTVEKAASLLMSAKKVLVLTGAGISTSCGIPDFRSASGVYSMLGEYALNDPQDLFAISYFRRNVKPFYHFARKLWPGTHKPAATHGFIKVIGSSGNLLRNYTQNIDTLEQVAGIEDIVQCHGSFATATCTRCKYKCDGESIKADVMAGKPPMCPKCLVNPPPSLNSTNTEYPLGLSSLIANEHGLPFVDPIFDKGCMKPDIVFFGEKLPTHFFDTIEADVEKCDLVLVMGTSLKVAPVSRIVEMVDSKIPQLLINREVVGEPHEFDVELLGDCDVVVTALAKQLGWSLDTKQNPEREVDTSYKVSDKANKCHRYLFQGGVENDSDCDSSDSESDEDSKDNSTSPDCEHDSSSESKILLVDENESKAIHKRRYEEETCSPEDRRQAEPTPANSSSGSKKLRTIE